jgi:transposase-like protein
MPQPLEGTYALRREMRNSPELARKRIFQLYEETRSVAAVAQRLGVPPRTMQRFVAEDAELHKQIVTLRNPKRKTGRRAST